MVSKSFLVHEFKLFFRYIGKVYFSPMGTRCKYGMLDAWTIKSWHLKSDENFCFIFKFMMSSFHLR